MTTHVLKGKVSWTKLVEPNTYEGYTFWCLNFFPLDKDEMMKHFEMGTSLKLRETKKPDEIPSGKFVRYTKKVFRPDGTKNDRPVVLDKDGAEYKKTWIPNGSLCEVYVKTFETSKGMGHELEKVIVLQEAQKPAPKGKTTSWDD